MFVYVSIAHYRIFCFRLLEIYDSKSSALFLSWRRRDVRPRYDETFASSLWRRLHVRLLLSVRRPLPAEESDQCKNRKYRLMVESDSRNYFLGQELLDFFFIQLMAKCHCCLPTLDDRILIWIELEPLFRIGIRHGTLSANRTTHDVVSQR